MSADAENLDKCYEVVSAAVQKAGEVINSIKFIFHELNSSSTAFQLIASRFWKSKNIKTKLSDIDLVTETDQEVEKLLINTLVAEFPHHR